MSVGLDQAERKQLRLTAREATLLALRLLGGEAHRDAIHDLALERGGFTARELAAEPPAEAAGKYARLVDHQLSWALTNLKREGLVENPARGVWRLVGAAVEEAASVLDASAEAPRLHELQAMPYRKYLRTPEWRRARAAALERAGNACSLDVTHVEALEVHHRTYERRGQELSSDLVVLCAACHRLHHKQFGRPGRARAARPDRPAARRELARKPSLLRRLLTG